MWLTITAFGSLPHSKMFNFVWVWDLQAVEKKRDSFDQLHAKCQEVWVVLSVSMSERSFAPSSTQALNY